MIAVTNEQEIFNLHSCLGRVSDSDSNVIKELTSKVLATACICKENDPSTQNTEINNNKSNNDEPIYTKEDGSKFIQKLFGLVRAYEFYRYCTFYFETIA